MNLNRFMGSIRLRPYLLLTSFASLGVILISLFFCYMKMVLTWNETMLLTAVTIGAAILSLLLHIVMTRPIEQAIDLLCKESQLIADGEFHGELPLIGPVELQKLSGHFNEMSKRLDESFHQLRSSEAARRELIANVSHDLRTPLASIQSFVEALQDDLIEDPVTYQKYLSTIRLETHRVSAMINDLFDLSRIEARAEAFEPKPYYLDNLIVETLQSHLLQIEEKRIEVICNIPDRLPTVWIVPEQLKRVLSNLLNNALRHSSPDGTILIMAQLQDSEYIKVIVEDRGEGIEPADQIRLFERFYRADKSRSRSSGGSGLGLAIVKSIVDLHGGQTGLESKPGEGSRFWFTVRTASGEMKVE